MARQRRSFVLELGVFPTERRAFVMLLRWEARWAMDVMDIFGGGDDGDGRGSDRRESMRLGAYYQC